MTLINPLTLIGSSHDAQKAFDGHLPYLGEGGYRNAYIDFDSKVVYKVENYEGVIDSSNDREYRNYIALPTRQLTSNIAIVPMSFYQVDGGLVNASIYIDGIHMSECTCNPFGTGALEPDHDEVCLPDEVLNLIHNAGFGDMGYGNVIFSSGTYFVVDLDV